MNGQWLKRTVCLVAGALLCGAPALAHKPSDSYLSLDTGQARMAGRWDISLRDLEHAIGLDADGNGEITWGEVRARHADIAAYALSRLNLQGDGKACPLRVTGQLVENHGDGAYSVLQFEADCAGSPAALEVSYALLFDIDLQHRGLLRLQHAGRTHTSILSPDRSRQRFELDRPSATAHFFTYGGHGVWHIWIGFDHILFLLALLLPSVLRREAGRWQVASGFDVAFWDVFKIVTSFTVAHSITLGLAALGVVAVPSRIAESAIAFSVLIAAANNIWPLVTARRWVVAFAFGLVHGFGFAGALAELGLPQESLVVSLLAFNLGVELGQLVIVLAFLPVAFGLRATGFYQRYVLQAGSAAIAVLAAHWLIERLFDLSLLPR